MLALERRKLRLECVLLRLELVDQLTLPSHVTLQLLMLTLILLRHLLLFGEDSRRNPRLLDLVQLLLLLLEGAGGLVQLARLQVHSFGNPLYLALILHNGLELVLQLVDLEVLRFRLSQH
jgi:hypothetical protein